MILNRISIPYENESSGNDDATISYSIGLGTKMHSWTLVLTHIES